MSHQAFESQNENYLTGLDSGNSKVSMTEDIIRAEASSVNIDIT
jgi:hypothetical protein